MRKNLSDHAEPKKKPRKLGQSDRGLSVGDFLVEVDETLRPMIDLYRVLDNTRQENPEDPCRIPYRDERDAWKAQTRLRLLVQDGKDIAISRAMSDEVPEPHWRLTVPHALLERIHDRISWFIERRDMIATHLGNHKIRAAGALRENLWKDLSERGLVVTIPEDDLLQLLELYGKLPNIEALGGVEEQLKQILPLVQHLVDESGARKGELGAQTLQETAFILKVKKIGDEVFRQRHQVGRSEDPNDSRCYFPDDLTPLLKAALERGLGEGRLDPDHQPATRDAFSMLTMPGDRSRGR